MDIKNSQFVRQVVSELAVELAQHTDRPVAVKLSGSSHLQTCFGSDATTAITVEINPAILKPVRNEVTARELLRASGFYRLQHQLCPVAVQAEVAAREGFRAVFTVLNDEHNERQSAARDASLGALLQTLSAHAYRKSSRRRGDVVVGVAAPKVAGTMESVEAYVAGVNEFAYHLRRRLPGEDNTAAVVTEALALVPDNLKDMSKDDLVGVARQIHAVLSRGIELPRVELVVPIVEAAVTRVDDETEEDEPEAIDALLNLNPVEPAWWLTVLRSRAAFVTLGVSVFFWLVLCLSVGWNFWLATIVSLAFMTLSLGGVYYLARQRELRREYEARGEQPPVGLGGSLVLCWNGFWSHIGGLFGDIRVNVTGGTGIRNFFAVCWRAWVDNIWVPFTVTLERCRQAIVRASCDAYAYSGEFLQGIWYSSLAGHVRTGLVGLYYGVRDWTARTAYLLWQNVHFRLFLIGLPIAVMLCLTYALAAFGSQLSAMQLVLMVAVLAVFLGVGWYYRAQIRAFLTADVFTDNEELDTDVACRLPVNKEITTFTTITHTVPVDASPEFLNGVADEVAEAAQPLRQSLSRLGIVACDRDNQATGFDLIDDIETAALGEVNLFVDDAERHRTRLAIDVVVDCSDSQNDSTTLLRRGEKFKRARKMALAIEAAVKGRRGASARIWGYTDAAIYDCGAAGSGRASGLPCGGGNNDAAALQHAAQSVSARNGVTRVVVLISDSQPADCTWGALHTLGWELIQQGIVVVQVTTDQCDDQPLPWNVVDLHEGNLLEATTHLGHMLEAQLAHC